MKLDRPALPGIVPPPAVVRGGDALRRGLAAMHGAATLPPVRIFEQLGGMAELVLTGIIAERGVPDVLADGPATADEVARRLDLDAVALGRMLTFLAGRGVVARKGDRFRLTAVSDLLRSDHPDSLRDWAVFAAAPWVMQAWSQAGAAVHGRVPFEAAHDLPFFEMTAADDSAGTAFDAAMRAGAGLTSQLLLRECDVSGVRSMCDVGGGTGGLVAAFLEHHPTLRGCVTDLPATVDRARSHFAEVGLSDRAEAIAADFFVEVPAGHDRYVLVAIVHDWSDEDAVRILRTVRNAMHDDARLWVVDFVQPEHDGDSLVRAIDVLMLILAGGRERSRAEFDALWSAADLEVVNRTPLVNGAVIHELARA